MEASQRFWSVPQLCLPVKMSITKPAQLTKSEWNQCSPAPSEILCGAIIPWLPPPPQCPIIAELSNVYRLFNDFLRFVAKSIKQNKLFFQTFYLLSHQNQSLRIRSELCFVFQSHQLAGVERREETHKARPVRHQQQGMVSWDLILSSRPSDGLVLSTFNCSHKSSKRFSMRLSSPCILSVNVYKHFLALKQPMIYLTIFRRPVFCVWSVWVQILSYY